MTIRVLVAEDEETVRQALVELLGQAEDVDVVGAASDTDSAIELARATQADVALVDVKMPGGGGPRATREIIACSPSTRVIGLSAYDDRSSVVAMLRSGAIGYLVKGTGADQIVTAMRHAVQGDAVLSREVTADVIHELVENLDRSEALAERLREEDRRKTELVQVMAHELRTPISVIEAFGSLVTNHGDSLTADRLAEIIDPLRRSIARIVRLAANIATAVSLGAEDADVAARPVEVESLLSRIEDEFAGERERLRLVPPARHVRLWADPELAVRALALVVENALDFSAGSEVLIEVEPDRDTVWIVVRDRGPGIPDEFRQRIFEPFSQADMTERRERPGAGIGLFLTRLIMAAHGGSVTYEPRAGGGTTMSLGFPALLGAEAPPPVVQRPTEATG